jgi:hypothetical protein
MKFDLTINCDNAAFDDKPQEEVARILRELASKLCGYDLSYMNCGPLRDNDGNRHRLWNRVGEWEYVPDCG